MTTIPSLALEEQAWLLHAATERLEVCYLKAKQKGIESPVLFLLDLNDSFAYELAQATTDEQKLNEFWERRESGVKPILTSHLSLTEAINFLTDDFDEICQVMREWLLQEQGSSVPVVIIANEIVSLAAWWVPDH